MFMFSTIVTFRLVIQSSEVEKTLLYWGKTCRQDSIFGLLKQGFRYIRVRYIRVRYILVMCHNKLL